MEERRNKYREIYRHFADLIDADVLRPGDRIPSQKIIGEQFGASYASVSKAMRDLLNDLYIDTTNHGSFVRLAGHDRVMQQVCDLLNVIEGMGVSPCLVAEGDEEYIIADDVRLLPDPDTGRWKKITV